MKNPYCYRHKFFLHFETSPVIFGATVCDGIWECWCITYTLNRRKWLFNIDSELLCFLICNPPFNHSKQSFFLSLMIFYVFFSKSFYSKIQINHISKKSFFLRQSVEKFCMIWLIWQLQTTIHENCCLK